MLALLVPHLPEFIKNFIDGLLEPTTYFILSVVGLWAMIQFRANITSSVGASACIAERLPTA